MATGVVDRAERATGADTAQAQDRPNRGSGRERLSASSSSSSTASAREGGAQRRSGAASRSGSNRRARSSAGGGYSGGSGGSSQRARKRRPRIWLHGLLGVLLGVGLVALAFSLIWPSWHAERQRKAQALARASADASAPGPQRDHAADGLTPPPGTWKVEGAGAAASGAFLASGTKLKPENSGPAAPATSASATAAAAGSVTPAELGLPLYPGARPDPQANSRVRDAAGGTTLTLGLISSDSPERIRAFYRTRLQAGSSSAVREGSAGTEQWLLSSVDSQAASERNVLIIQEGSDVRITLVHWRAPDRATGAGRVTAPPAPPLPPSPLRTLPTAPVAPAAPAARGG